jgi:MarR family transcriptional regulator for hemolysin
MARDEWDPTLHPSYYVSRIARGLQRVGDVRLQPLGFASAQIPVLAALKDGSRSQAELARLAGVEQPTMAQLLARMERDGLTRREPDPTDRRASRVSLTRKALARLPEARALLRHANRELTQGLSDDEAATLLDLLRRVLANVDALER